MPRQALQLGSLAGLLLLVVAGCNDASSPAVVVAERTESAVEAPTNATSEPAGENPASAASPAAVVPAVAPATTPASTNVQPAPPAPRGPTKEVTFDTVKLALEKDQPFERSLLTPEVLAIDNQPIRIRGYILPSFQQTGIKQFVLVRDNQECCFGPGAALHDCIVVDMKPGKTTQYTVRPVAVEGVFSIREMKGLDDKHLAIYHLDGESVE
ncbi:MAG: DUF3299 domain-containing protein [Pirellulales bacterium]|nr:DUF3299 domain-containing protein [Pirellulales bacterium]